jgi:hypothetical protein
MNITRNELIGLLNEVKTSTFVHLLTETKVRMNKTGNPFFDKVIKRSSCNYLIGNDYQIRVWGNGEKEGIPQEENNFEVEEMKGKKHLSKVVCIDTKTESVYYLMVERFDEIKPKVEYTFEGNPIEKQLFESYMVKVSESQKQPQERKVKVLTFKIDNIKEITLNKVKYQVVE